jgi:hypothetical protein
MTDPDGQGSTDRGPGDAQPAGPEPRPELDIDAAFAAIIADFSTSPPSGTGPWPASEDLDEDLHDADPDGSGRAGDQVGGPDDSPDDDGRGDGRARLDDGRQRRDHRRERRDSGRRRIVLPDDSEDDSRSDRSTGDDEDDEGYVPPDPPPIPRGDLVVRIAWTAVLGGPLFLLVAALTWQDLPAFLLFIALLAFIGGFVTLVARMPAERPDDPDDGAVV